MPRLAQDTQRNKGAIFIMVELVQAVPGILGG
jgi:hypothetical protein